MRGLLLSHRKQYRVSSVKSAQLFFQNYMEGGKGDRGFRIRFVEMPEFKAIELQTHSDYDLNMMERAFRDAKIIRKEIPFYTNPVVKMSAGRRDGNLYNPL